MRKSLGRIFVIIFIFLYAGLSASTYKWSSYSAKKELYVNETVYLKYICDFSDRGELFTIILNPVYDENHYSFKLMKKQDTFRDGKRVSTYEYLAQAKVEGSLVFELEASMRETTLESIVYSSGSRDDDRGDEAYNEKILSIHTADINVIPSNSDIVGEFKIEVKKDKAQVQAYEPYHLDIQISGLGNLDDLEAIEYQIEGVKVFSQKPLRDIKHTKDGDEGTWSQKFAFVSDKDFTVPRINIKYFDLKSKTIQNLEIDSSDIKVMQVYKKEELLDDVEENSYTDIFTGAKSFIYYLLTFIAGFLLAKINFKKEKIDSKSKIFFQKVEATKSLDELSMLLILNNERKFSDLLLEFDTDNTITLSKAKKRVSTIT